jgi:hypothetical protein
MEQETPHRRTYHINLYHRKRGHHRPTTGIQHKRVSAPQAVAEQSVLLFGLKTTTPQGEAKGPASNIVLISEGLKMGYLFIWVYIGLYVFLCYQEDLKKKKKKKDHVMYGADRCSLDARINISVVHSREISSRHVRHEITLSIHQHSPREHDNKEALSYNVEIMY